MESTSQQTRNTKGVSLIGAIMGMAITFLGGIFVGLHPSWLPLKPAPAAEPDPALFKIPQMPTSMPMDTHGDHNATTMP